MLLDVQNLRVTFSQQGKPFDAVKGVSFTIAPGEAVGIVGESGSGKSTVAHALMGLLHRQEVQVQGTATLEGVDLLSLSRQQLRHYQGNELSIIFQEPMTSLNPTMKIGTQVEEGLRIHTKLSSKERRIQALEAMALAGLPNPQDLYHRYPHELSGGMRQRVMIASALVLRPKLLLADEPTTALDVTIQAQILDTLREIHQKEGLSILFISHDLGVIKALCQRVLVMCQGELVEQGDVDQIFHHPSHPYTQKLLASRPTRTKLQGGTSHG